MNATINGKNWKADSAFGYYINYSGNDSGVINLEIIATQSNNDTLSTIIFNITNYTGPNTYPINPPVNTATYYLGNNRFYADSGVITVTADTAYAITGTFHFTVDTFRITNGTFNVALP